MVIPNAEDLQLELSALSSSLYDCLGMSVRLGPTYKEWDRYRSKEWCTAKSLLSVYDMPFTSEAWAVLLGRYGFQHPSMSEVQKAAYKRKEERRVRRPYIDLDEDYPELVASSRIDVVTQDGTTITYWSLR